MGGPQSFTALVALRTKRGEFRALETVNSADQIHNVQPLLEFDPSNNFPSRQLDQVEKVIRKFHDFDRLVMVDASALTSSSSFGSATAGALGELANRLAHPADLFSQHEPINFIPVIRHNDSENRLSTLGHLSMELETGAALRVQTSSMTAQEIEKVLTRIGLPLEKIDLILDLQYVPKLTSYLADSTSIALAHFTNFGAFRSTSLLSGSVPSFLKQTDSWHQDRHEELLWQEIIQNGATHVRFGDYGVVHPLASQGFRSKHVSFKYSCAKHWLYLRERGEEPGETEEPAEDSSRARTLRLICQKLTESEDFSGPDFSWGDKEIAIAAKGRGNKLGSTSTPVALATSHHLAYLAARAA